MTTSANWIQQAREKIQKHAGTTQTKDDQAVAEAFAQQAYTAVGNRDRKIMCDPYLLGFEIVDKNEENNRLVGVFAFRVSGEILMVPVFFLNGKIKGQDLLYRKPVNRFYPNTEKWISYFVGRGEDENGRPVDRRNNADARIHLGVDRMSRMPGGYKRAGLLDFLKRDAPSVAPAVPKPYKQFNAEMGSDPDGSVPGEFWKWLHKTQLHPADQNFRRGPGYLAPWETLNTATGAGNHERPSDFSQWLNNKDAGLRVSDEEFQSIWKEASVEDRSVFINAEWKEACDNSGFRPEHIEQFMFADFLADTGMGKQAAALANRVPWFADSIVLAGLLDKPLTKKASAPKRSLEYHVDPVPGSSEAEVSAHFLRGYSFVDKRAAESLSTAVDSSPFSRAWSSLRKTGINQVAGKDGTFQKVLWAPTTSGDDSCAPYPIGSTNRNGPLYTSYPEHRLVFLEGPDKGCVLTYRNGCPEEELPLFTDDAEFDWRDKGEAEKEATAGELPVPGAPPAPVTTAPAAPPIPATPPAGEPPINGNTGHPFGFVAGQDKAANSFGNELAIGAPLGAGLGLLAGPSLGVSPLEGMVGGGLLGTAGTAAYHQHNRDPEADEARERDVLHAREAAGQPLAPEEKARLVELLARYRQSKQAGELKVPGASSPEKGKVYVVWLPKLERLFGEPFRVDSIESTGDVTKINFENGPNYGETRCRLILRKDLEETCAADLKGGPNSGMPRVVGSDAVWIPVEAQLTYEHGMPKTPANICCAEFQPPANFQPVTMNTIDEALANSKKASLTIERNPRSGLLALRDHKGKIRVEDYTPRRMAIKLARDLRLPGAEAIELVDLALTQTKTAFNLLAPGYMDALSKALTGMTRKEAKWMKEAKEFDALPEKEAANLFDLARALGTVSRTFKAAPIRTVGAAATAAGAGAGMGYGGYKMFGPSDSDGPETPAPDAGSTNGPSLPSPEDPVADKPGMADKLKEYATNPLILGGLAAGTGAVAYGLSQKNKKKKRPGYEDEPEDKEAHAQFYDRDIDPEEDFDDYDYEEDLGLPVEHAGQFQDFAEARRERYSRPAGNYLDAHDPGQGRNSRYHDDPDHIPDEMILRMVHPMEEMSRIGQQLGLDTMMDHGAVASMVKVYDVKPYMREYISKLENSLDHLGRLVFMLYWKPKDFSELFGQDDIPQIENKLTGVFSSYGDLILELLQSSGGEGSIR
jgi:hypothetical protein